MAEPEWRRVAEAIRQQIRTGENVTVREDGSRRLPNYEQLQDLHGTSYGTLRAALLVLEAEGWITRRPGVAIDVREDHPK